MQNETELTLEQTQQGVNDEVLVKRTVSSAAKLCQGDSLEFYQITVKEFKKDEYPSFQDKERYEHVGLEVTRPQEGKRSQDDEKR
ncbi:hypothetical protein Tco_0065369 [Tanacetum coccineum]